MLQLILLKSLKIREMAFVMEMMKMTWTLKWRETLKLRITLKKIKGRINLKMLTELKL
jgi:hypothetical protein